MLLTVHSIEKKKPISGAVFAFAADKRHFTSLRNLQLYVFTAWAHERRWDHAGIYGGQ
jgi:hypothetical protein